MKKLLVAIDFSESCTNAIFYVKELVKGTPLQVDMIHVHSMPVVSMINMSVNITDEVLDANTEHTKNLLDEQMLLLPSENRGETFPVHGEYASSEIIALAVDLESDLIVMALRQKYSIIDRVIGTITAQTIAKSALPILAIPNGCLFKTSSNVLLLTDESYSGKLTDQMASELERLFDYCDFYKDTEIHLVHINEGEKDSFDLVYHHAPLADLKFIVSNASTVAQGVKRVLEEYNIDLIAIHRKNSTFWERLFHSSLTRKLLFQAKLPIFVIAP